MTPSPAAAHDPSAPFTLAHARSDHWGLAAKSCLEGIAAAAPAANLGILYATEVFAADLPSILTFLRETTRIEHWIGAAAPGILAGDAKSGAAEYRDGGALAVMVGSLPPDAVCGFHALDAASFRTRTGAWIAEHQPCAGLVHGDPRNPAIAELVAAAGNDVGFLAGGLASGGSDPAQVAGSVTSGGLAGVLLSAAVPVVAGVTQGCSPLGAFHEVTEAVEGVVMKLDGRPALDVLKDEAGELIARNLRRAAGYIHVALPVQGSGTRGGHSGGGDYVVRNLLGIDPPKGWLAVGERVAPGQRLMFVRRDANAAQADLRRMAADVRTRLGGRPVRAAIYVTCIARGRHMFGEDGGEVAILREELGPDAPLIGFFANGEISGHNLFSYTGVLAALAGEK